MTRADVIAFADYAPYTDSREEDGTTHLDACDCKHGKGVFLLFFSKDGRLELVQAVKFAGANYQDARGSALAAYDSMTGHYGKVEILGVKAVRAGSVERIRFLDKEAFLAVLDRLWGRAPRALGDLGPVRDRTPEAGPTTPDIHFDATLTHSGNVASGHAANVELTLNLVPEIQPRDERVVAQLSYSTELKQFFVAFYRDLPTAPDRTSLPNVKFSDAGPKTQATPIPSL